MLFYLVLIIENPNNYFYILSQRMRGYKLKNEPRTESEHYKITGPKIILLTFVVLFSEQCEFLIWCLDFTHVYLLVISQKGAPLRTHWCEKIPLFCMIFYSHLLWPRVNKAQVDLKKGWRQCSVLFSAPISKNTDIDRQWNFTIEPY